MSTRAKAATKSAIFYLSQILFVVTVFAIGTPAFAG